MMNRDRVKIAGRNDIQIELTPELVSHIFDEEPDRILRELPPDTDREVTYKYRQARQISEAMIINQQFYPI